MKNLLIHASVLALLATAGSITNANQVEAASISNPKCVQGLRKAQSGSRYQAFAMTSGGAHCGWTIQSSSSQSAANKAAMRYCKSSARGAKCYVAWPN